MKNYKIGDSVEFFFLGSKKIGHIKQIDRKNKSYYIESDGINYPSVRVLKEGVKLKEKPVWYIKE